MLTCKCEDIETLDKFTVDHYKWEYGEEYYRKYLLADRAKHYKCEACQRFTTKKDEYHKFRR